MSYGINEPPSHEFEIMQTLLSIAGDVAATKTAVEGLAGPNGRVTALEAQMKTQNFRNWIKTGIVVPIVTGLHLVAKHFGF
jgi:hypothetical protein